MKTNSAARRVWKLGISIASLAIVALASLDLWAVSYCYRNLAMTSVQQTCTQPVWNGPVAGSEVFLAIR